MEGGATFSGSGTEHYTVGAALDKSKMWTAARAVAPSAREIATATAGGVAAIYIEHLLR
jgi:hypothetical protein